MKKTLLVIITIAIVSIFSGRVYAAMFSLLPEAITLSELKPGDTYSLGGDGGITWKLSYHGRDDVRVVFKSIKPDQPLEGYAPVLDAGWLRPEHAAYENVKPGSTIETSVVLDLPDDKILAGKNFVVILEARAYDISTGKPTKLADRSKIFIKFAGRKKEDVEDILLNTDKKSIIEPPVSTSEHVDTIAIGDASVADEQITQAIEKTVERNYIRLHPYIIDAGTIVPGTITESRKPLEIINIGESDTIVRIKQISLDKSGLKENATGYKSLPDGVFLVFTEREIEVKAGWSVEVSFYIGIPVVDEIVSGSYAIVVEVSDIANPEDKAESIVKFLLK